MLNHHPKWMAFNAIEIPNINYAHSIRTPNFLAVCNNNYGTCLLPIGDKESKYSLNWNGRGGNVWNPQYYILFMANARFPIISQPKHKPYCRVFLPQRRIWNYRSIVFLLRYIDSVDVIRIMSCYSMFWRTLYMHAVYATFHHILSTLRLWISYMFIVPQSANSKNYQSSLAVSK